MDEKEALQTARKIAEVFGKIEDEKSDHPSYIRQLAFVTPKEREAAVQLIRPDPALIRFHTIRLM